MSAAPAELSRPPTGWAGWPGWPGIRRLARPGAAVAIVALAYHYSLRTLAEALELDSPLAYLALVPLIALVIAAGKAARDDVGIHDRQVDYIIGLPLIGAACFAALVLPARMSTMFWVWRVDLLTLPLFAAGVVTLLFGARTLWRVRLALAFLFLAWPLPYLVAMNLGGLERFTAITIKGLKAVSGHLPIPVTSGGGDGSLFGVTHGAHSVVLSVASACSGVNGLLGFLLVGAALQAFVEGSRTRRILWLAAGAALVWMTNFARIILIFAAAALWGGHVAFDILHPYVGLVFFNAAMLASVWGLRFFGLKLRSLRRAQALPHRPRARAAAAVLVVVAASLGLLNANLTHAGAVASSLGAPRLASFATGQKAPQGWKRAFVTRYDWAQRFFGSDSTWARYSYLNSSDSGSLSSTIPVIADVISTSHLGSFSIYGIEACYKFHGFSVSKPESVDLGSGVVGGLLTWSGTDDRSTWSTLYWHWPVKAGKQVRYERVTLLLRDTQGGRYQSPDAQPDMRRGLGLRLSDTIQGRPKGPPLTAEQAKERGFLLAFGEALVAGRASQVRPA